MKLIVVLLIYAFNYSSSPELKVCISQNTTHFTNISHVINLICTDQLFENCSDDEIDIQKKTFHRCNSKVKQLAFINTSICFYKYVNLPKNPFTYRLCVLRI